jgi:hypothetical protein
VGRNRRGLIVRREVFEAEFLIRAGRAACRAARPSRHAAIVISMRVTDSSAAIHLFALSSAARRPNEEA